MGEDCACIDEKSDKVPKQPEVTAWKRAARRHQCEWRESKGMAQGESPTRLTEPDGDRGRNFLCPESEAAARARFAKFADPRLKGDLLSSMPMCFNLFGPLARNQELAKKAIAAWFPDVGIPGAKVKVIFEWSPGRRDPKYLNDRTAFDVAFLITKGETKHLVGIETKYHEHPEKEPASSRSRMTGETKKRVPKRRYYEVSEEHLGVDRERVDKEVWTTTLEQVWRDHLLALACQQDGYSKVKYVLVAPQGNPAWPALANDYLELIPSAADTFEFRTIEQLLGAVPGRLPQEQAFRERYLDVKHDPSA